MRSKYNLNIMNIDEEKYHQLLDMGIPCEIEICVNKLQAFMEAKFICIQFCNKELKLRICKKNLPSIYSSSHIKSGTQPVRYMFYTVASSMLYMFYTFASSVLYMFYTVVSAMLYICSTQLYLLCFICPTQLCLLCFICSTQLYMLCFICSPQLLLPCFICCTQLYLL